MMAERPVLEVRNVTIGYRQRSGWREAVRDVSFSIPGGQTCGLVGESGSGKTTLALAIIRFLPEEGAVRSGEILFGGENLLELGPRGMRKIWGARLALVPQDPLSSLNPTLRLGDQATEILRHHQGLHDSEARERVMELFEHVELADPERVFAAYPHQLSGGMLQRVLIAMSLSTEPELLLLDEPTSSLDVTTQATILDLLRNLMSGRDTAILYITHNLGVVAQIADRVAVLYAGELVEEAPTAELFRKPLHPYTQGLMDSVPRLGQSKQQVAIRAIEGRIPAPEEIPTGCVFRPRCPLAVEVCKEDPPFYETDGNRRSRCHRWGEIDADEVDPHQPAGESLTVKQAQGSSEPVLQIEDLEVYFAERRSLMDVVARRPAKAVKAVDGITIEVDRGRTLGLVGESGSGKTTMARAVVGLAKRTGGTVGLHGEQLPAGLSGRDRKKQRLLQIVFQDPQEALNPYRSVGEVLRRPIMRLRSKSAEEAKQIAEDLLNAVHLAPSYAERLPGQLSGGEKQRVAIARAFAPDPDLLIADEPVTSLDVSVQASILNLLHELQVERKSSTLFISHDLAVVGYLADDIAVIYLGHLMETGPAAAVFEPPYHPYTEALLSSVPLMDPNAEQKEIRLGGEIPSPSEEITGCPFHTRCPRFLGDVCVNEVPPWRVHEETGKRFFCHIPADELMKIQERSLAFGMGDPGEE